MWLALEFLVFTPLCPWIEVVLGAEQAAPPHANATDAHLPGASKSGEKRSSAPAMPFHSQPAPDPDELALSVHTDSHQF